MTCKNCKYFELGYFEHRTDVWHPEDGCYIKKENYDQDFGMCLNEKVSSDYVNGWMERKRIKNIDGIHANSNDDRGYLEVGKDFGCIHWQEKK